MYVHAAGIFEKMSGVKSVLVKYMERRKIFEIPSEKNSSDVMYLTEEFKHEFSLELSDVTFQRYDEEWGMEVDLEPHKSITNKDKLVAVVSPKLCSDSVGSYKVCLLNNC